MTTTTDIVPLDWVEALISVMGRLDKPDILKRDNSGLMDEAELLLVEEAEDELLHEAEYVVNYVRDLTGWSLKRINKNPDKAITLYLKDNPE